MVNMAGFHHREPEYNTAGPGEEGYYIKIRPLSTPEHPKRAKVSTPCGHGFFHDVDDAQEFMETPHREMAEAYIEWLHEGHTVAPDERIMCRRVSQPWEVTDEH